MDAAAGETKWLALYAPASWLFQIFIGWHIVGWISGLSTALATVAAISLAVALFIMPTWRSIQHWLAPDAGRGRSTARRRLMVGGAALAAFTLLVPLPNATTVPGVLTLPDAAFVRTDTDGFIAEWLARDGDRVVTGQPVARLEDPALAAQANELNSQLNALQSRQFGSLLRDPREAGDLRAQIAGTVNELAEIRARLAGLTLRAGSNGTLALPHADDLLGTFLARGHTIGHVLQPDALKVHAVVPDGDAAHVRDATEAVSVRTRRYRSERGRRQNSSLRRRRRRHRLPARGCRSASADRLPCAPTTPTAARRPTPSSMSSLPLLTRPPAASTNACGCVSPMPMHRWRSSGAAAPASCYSNSSREPPEMRQLRLALPWFRPSPARRAPRDDAPLDWITMRWRQLRHAAPASRVAPHLAAAKAIRSAMKQLPADSINGHALRERAGPRRTR